ncbi:hypothetical protein [Duganella levis]|uniref:Uncharacterized protein n=1 Tax=Duganella levis TaxID=2692169 RepID=A0ABW9VZ64_9BURK|nr:hypothetical protein [Duganella levis]MYN26956.1 hypothetical protein [Duganella levis]
MRLVSILIPVTMATIFNAAHAEDFRPNAQQAAQIGATCKNWRPIAKGVYMLKSSGEKKPKANNSLHARIIEEIYSPKSSVASEGMAESAGEQFCIQDMKETLRNSGRASQQ